MQQINKLRSDIVIDFAAEELKKLHRMLKGRFNWLFEKNFPISVANYKKTIIGIRNDAVHEGICPSHADTKLCLDIAKHLLKHTTQMCWKRNQHHF